MRFRVILLVASLGVGVLVTAIVGEEPDVNAEKQWAKDKEEFRAELKKLKQGVLEQLATLEEKARDRGDVAKVKRLKAESEAFEERDEFPSSIERVAYNKRRKTSEETLRQAFKKVQTALLKAKRDADVDELQSELAELLDPANPKVASAPEGSAKSASRRRWVNTSYGSIIYQVEGKKWAEIETQTRKVKWELQETSRTAEYVELFNPTRKETWRVFNDSVELKTGSERKVIANGRWEDSSK